MTLYVVRHASAGTRTSSPDDVHRPLDRAGRAEAGRLWRYLVDADAPVDQILSSPALRCRETVAPLARAFDLDVEVADALWEGQGHAPALALARRLASAGVAALLCTHGDVVPPLLDELARDGVRLSGNGNAKGSLWELQVRQGRITDGRYVPAPGTPVPLDAMARRDTVSAPS